MKPTNLNRVLIFFLIGIILVVLAPWFFTRNWGYVSFGTTNEVGDTIGGITAPITSLIGSILVYFALREQITANNLIQIQFERQKEDEIERKRLLYITEQINIIKSDLNNFTFTYRDKDYKFNYSGSDAIKEFFERKRHAHHVDHDGKLITPKVIELLNLLQVFDSLVKVVNEEKIAEEDRSYFNSILRYLFNSKIKPAFDFHAKDRMSLHKECPSCGIKHTGLPDELFDVVDSISNQLGKGK